MACARGEEPRVRLADGGAIDVLRFPLTRSSTGEVAEAGVLGDLKMLSFGLVLSILPSDSDAAFEGIESGCRVLIEGRAVALRYQSSSSAGCESESERLKKSNVDAYDEKLKGGASCCS